MKWQPRKSVMKKFNDRMDRDFMLYIIIMFVSFIFGILTGLLLKG